MSDYSEKLKDPRWQKMRLMILERDGWKCRNCGAEDKTLHVHHLAYSPGVEPWNYDIDILETLCEECHEAESLNRQEWEYQLLKQLKLWGFRWINIKDIAECFQKGKRANIAACTWVLTDMLRAALTNDEYFYAYMKHMIDVRKGIKKAGLVPNLRKAYADYLRKKRRERKKG